MKEYSIIFVCFVLFVFSNVIGKKTHYRAAIFEYNTYSKQDNMVNHLKKNLQAYETATRTASKNGADIIVFPEDGLYPKNDDRRHTTSLFSEDIPNPKEERTNPCTQTETFFDRPVLSRLSCLAKHNKIYIVADMIDFNKCSFIKPCKSKGKKFCQNKDCPHDGMLLYNTNVVFDREGTLIAKYYKKHQFFEHDRDLPKKLEDVFFETDFGNFTTFVCFDLMFGESNRAIEKSGVTNVAYPTYWYDQIPQVYLAVPFQQAWAMTNNVNLLAANSHVSGTGSLGSGIYSGYQGALVYTDSPDSHSRLLISNVPNKPTIGFSNLNIKRYIINGKYVVEEKKPKPVTLKKDKCQESVLGPPHNQEQNYRCHQVDTSNYKYFKLTKPQDKIRHCANNMCCDLSYKTKHLKEDYFLGIFGEKQKVYNLSVLGTEGCFLARCDTAGTKECKHLLVKSKTVFDYVKLKGNITSKYIYNYAIDSDIHLTDMKKWGTYRRTKIIYRNIGRKTSLLFLALLGRNFKQDVDYAQQSV